MVQRRAERMHARAGNRAEARLEADDAIEGSRSDHRAERLRTEREWNDTCRHYSGRTGRGPARRMVAVPRIDRRAGVAPCEFRRDRLAEDGRAEIAQALDD